MGRFVERFWDPFAHISRPIEAGDHPRWVFRAFVPHPVAQWAPSLDFEARNRLSRAEVALGGLADVAPSDETLPSEWLLRRAESAASSTIEGVHPSARRLARAEARSRLFRETPPPGDLEALRNIAATEQAIEIGARGRDVTADDLLAVHATLMGDDDPDAGRLRTRQSWIAAGVLSTPLDASYVPPPPEDVPALTEDLVAYINSYNADSLLAVALAHVQFETIHPFADGNGRTGRALMHLMLRRSGLTTGCTVPISSSLAMRRVEYVDALSRSHVACGMTDPERSAALGPWLKLMAESVINAASYAQRILAHLSDVRDRWRAQAAASGLRKSSAALRLIELLPRHPVLTTPHVMDLLGAKKHTALRSLNTLQRAGILVQRSAGRRNRVFEAEAIMDACASLASVRPGESDIRLPSLASDSPTALAPGHSQSPTAERRCNAKTKRGGRCRHPRPRPGGRCPAGHESP